MRVLYNIIIISFVFLFSCKKEDDEIVSNPTLSIQTSASIIEGNDGTTDVNIKLTLNKAAETTASIDYYTEHFTTDDDDIDIINSDNRKTATFESGSKETTITIKVNADQDLESLEEFYVHYGNRDGLVVNGNTKTIVRIDNDDICEGGCDGYLSPEAYAGYELTFFDEFDYTGLADNSKWKYEEWTPGWVNDEEQAYTSNSENSKVENGVLTITARNDGTPHKYTSARITTQGGQFHTGRIDVRAKLPLGRGSWPAIWMLGESIAHGTSWPDCGEIDIMEHVGHDPDAIHSTLHAKNYYWQIEEQQTGGITISNSQSQYHIYSCDWQEDKIEFYVDGELYFTGVPKGGSKDDLDAWPFSLAHDMILNIAIGGSWGGVQGIDDGAFPMEMNIDYVRYFKEKE